MPSELATICRIIEQEDGFLVASHYNPDGDAAGSSLALAHVLTAKGKTCAIYNVSGLPAAYGFIPAPCPVLTALPDPLPDRVFVLDCGSAERMGREMAEAADKQRIINIDHHLGNPEFGAVNWIDTNTPAVGGMIARLAQRLGVPLAGPLAEAVYLAVATDTGFFTYGSTTPETLELIAELFRLGLNPGEINPRITKTWTLSRMRLWSEVWARVELLLDDRLGMAVITREMYERTGTDKMDSDSVINYILRLTSVRVAAILREDGDDVYKFSLRSQGDDNVQAIAARFGGGGHKNAAGGTIEAPVAEVWRLIAEAVGRALDGDTGETI